MYWSPSATSKLSAPAATLGVSELSGTSQVPICSSIRLRPVTAKGDGAEPPRARVGSGIVGLNWPGSSTT